MYFALTFFIAHMKQLLWSGVLFPIMVSIYIYVFSKPFTLCFKGLP